VSATSFSAEKTGNHLHDWWIDEAQVEPGHGSPIPEELMERAAHQATPVRRSVAWL